VFWGRRFPVDRVAVRDAGKPGKLIVAAIMRKLVHWCYAVLKNRQAFDVQKALARG